MPTVLSARNGLILVAALGLLLALTLWMALPSRAGTDELTAQRQAELLHLLRQDCGACHGMRLTGGLGPALTPERLSDRSAEGLTQIILHGVPDTPMPPWGRYLNHSEAAWLARQLKKGP